MYKSIEDRYIELIEKAKQHSKEKFLSFVTGIYSVNPSLFNHLWDTPIVASEDLEEILPEGLTEEDKKIVKKQFSFDGSLGDSYATYSELNPKDEDISDTLKDFYERMSCIIVYNKKRAKEQWLDMLERNNSRENKKTLKEVEEAFIKNYSIILTHERCHQNADILVYRQKEDDDSRNIYQILNGAGIELDDNSIRNGSFDYFEDHNDVFMEFLARIIEGYEKGDSIEDCIERAIKRRKFEIDVKGETSVYSSVYDKSVLAMFVLFPDEMIEWGLFGAYDDDRRNVLKSKFEEVFGKDRLGIDDDKVSKGIIKYIKTREKEGNPISERQKSMILDLGFKLIEPEEIKAKAESDGISLLDIDNIYLRCKQILDGRNGIGQDNRFKSDSEGQDL